MVSVVAFATLVVVIVSLYWLTIEPQKSELQNNSAADDVCPSSARQTNNPQQSVGAAVLADEPGDQEALINRAIIVKAKCGQDE